MPDTDHIVDASGLNCPLPILRTRKTEDSMNTSQTPVRSVTRPVTICYRPASPGKNTFL